MKNDFIKMNYAYRYLLLTEKIELKIIILSRQKYIRIDDKIKSEDFNNRNPRFEKIQYNLRL